MRPHALDGGGGHDLDGPDTRSPQPEGDFDPSDAVESWDLTNRRDWEPCEPAQQGVRSSAYRPARHQIGGVNVHAFDNWYLDPMGLEAP